MEYQKHSNCMKFELKSIYKFKNIFIEVFLFLRFCINLFKNNYQKNSCQDIPLYLFIVLSLLFGNRVLTNTYVMCVTCWCQHITCSTWNVSCQYVFTYFNMSKIKKPKHARLRHVIHLACRVKRVCVLYVFDTC
jgi:hypothetical protein